MWQVRNTMKTVPIAGSMHLAYPANALTYDKVKHNWVAINAFYAKEGDEEKTPCSIKLAEWLNHPEIQMLIEDETMIKDLIFMNDKNVRIDEEDAISLNEQFDINAPVTAEPRKRIFTALLH